MTEEDHFTVPFTSLTTILLCFFIFLTSIAVPDLVRKKQLLKSLSNQFSTSHDSHLPFSSEQTKHYDIPIPELAIGFPQLNFSTRYSTIADTAEALDAEVLRFDDRFVISIAGEALFNSGDEQINAQFIPTLETIARNVRQQRLRLQIEGHTDDRPISSPRFKSNWELSIARAVSVLRFFIDKGVPADKLTASGRAQYQPIADNTTEEGRAKNRRVVLIIQE